MLFRSGREKYYAKRALTYKQAEDVVKEVLNNIKAVAGALE